MTGRIDALDDDARVISWISEVSGVSPSIVRSRLAKEQAKIGWNVAHSLEKLGIPSFQPSKDLDQFYAESDAFLYELVEWNRHGTKRRIRRWIGRFLSRQGQPNLRVLCIGDGLGADSAYLARRGHRVTYFEVSQLSIEFATRLFDHSRVSPEVCTHPSGLADESIDVLVCLDVLEHVEDVHGFLKTFVAKLRPGGLLITSAPFYLVATEFPTHLRCNQKLSGRIESLYGKHGLRLFDGRFDWSPLVFRREGGREPGRGASIFKRLALRLAGAPFLISRYWPWPLVKLTRLLR